jgi:hypothetical protein
MSHVLSHLFAADAGFGKSEGCGLWRRAGRKKYESRKKKPSHGEILDISTKPGNAPTDRPRRLICSPGANVNENAVKQGTLSP